MPPELCFAGRRLLIGVVHLRALPGAPLYGGALQPVLDAAVHDARALAEGGADALIVENFGDRPFYPAGVPPETVAAMAVCLAAVRTAAPALALGVNVLRNDARAALGLCAASGASFLRVNVLGSVAVSDQGLLEGRAHETLRERARLAPGARILADVHVKHARPLVAEPLASAGRDLLLRGLADALVVTGGATGEAPSAAQVAELRDALGEARLLVGSGVDERNATQLLARADGAIVGSSLKEGARLEAPVEPARVRRLREILDAL